MNRRSLLKGSLALAAGLVLPPTLAENAEAARKFMIQLDGTMVPQSFPLWIGIDPGFDPSNAVWWFDRNTNNRFVLPERYWFGTVNYDENGWPVEWEVKTSQARVFACDHRTTFGDLAADPDDYIRPWTI